MTKIVLSGEQILKANDINFEDVPCPEWAPEGTPEEEKQNVCVRIRCLTAEGRAYFLQRQVELELRKRALEDAVKEGVSADAATVTAPSVSNHEVMLVLKTAIDEQGNFLFSESQIADLMKRSGVPVSRCAAVASRLSGLRGEDAAKAVKPSGPAQS